MPDEALWDGYEAQESYTELEINGVLLQVRIEPDHRATIVRLLRCGLEDYLNPAYAPGNEIRFIPCLMKPRPQ
nr:YlzJ-like family protein [Paenibacillus caui]